MMGTRALPLRQQQRKGGEGMKKIFPAVLLSLFKVVICKDGKPVEVVPLEMVDTLAVECNKEAL